MAWLSAVGLALGLTKCSCLTNWRYLKVSCQLLSSMELIFLPNPDLKLLFGWGAEYSVITYITNDFNHLAIGGPFLLYVTYPPSPLMVECVPPSNRYSQKQPKRIDVVFTSMPFLSQGRFLLAISIHPSTPSLSPFIPPSPDREGKGPYRTDPSLMNQPEPARKLPYLHSPEVMQTLLGQESPWLVTRALNN